MPRKLILSRKGFDSGSGGCPSPIFPDGTMFSLPIPSYDDEAFEDLQHGDIDIASVVACQGRSKTVPAGCRRSAKGS